MGTIRLTLALSVLGAHTGFFFIMTGPEAVALFYLISGFLMTLILNGAYRNNFRGFYVNRFLRLVIPYWVVLAFVIAAYVVLDYRHPALQEMPIELGILTWFTNIFIVGSDWMWLLDLDSVGNFAWLPFGYNADTSSLSSYSFIPPIFTVALEIYFYAIAPFMIIGARRAWLFLLLSLAYCVFITLVGLSGIAWNYHFPLAPAIYFALGGIVCHFTVLGTIRSNRRSLAMLFVALIVFWLSETAISFPLLVLALVSIPVLFKFSGRNTVDRYLGHYSYPVYLIHFPVARLLEHRGTEPDLLFPYTLILTIFCAFLLHHLVENPVERIRQFVRTSGDAKLPIQGESGS